VKASGHRSPATVCLILGLALMTVALAWFTPFGAFPDELDHYERALSVGNGELVGVKTREPPVVVAEKTCCVPGNLSALAWVRQGVRLVEVDARQRPEQLPCTVVVTSERLGCGRDPLIGPQPNTMGTIEPLAYAPGGLAANVFDTPKAAYRVTRLAPALLGLVLVGLGVVALRRRFPAPAVIGGVLAYMSLGTLSVVASGSPNAFEVTGALCFLAGALALTDDGDVGTLDWWCLGAGGFALATSRSLGPIWIAALLLVGICAGSWRRGLDQVRAHRVPAISAATAIGVGTLFTVAWEAVVQPHVAFDFSFFLDQIGPTLSDARFASRQFFAAVGSLPPEWMAWTWLGAVGVLIASGLVVGNRQKRSAIVAAAALLAAAFVMVSAAVLRQNGFGIQGRHVLPMIGAVAIASGVAWRERTVSPVVTTVGAALIAGLVVVAWGYLRASYAATPAGLAPVAPTVRIALQTLDTFPSFVFGVGAVLAAAALPLSGWRRSDA